MSLASIDGNGAGGVPVAVRTSGLVKTFGEVRALDGIDLSIPAGQVFGVLGPNGAGKTTLIRVLATLWRPDTGTAEVFGHDVVGEAAKVRALVSVTGQSTTLDEDLTGLENLIMVSRLWGYDPPAARRRAVQLLTAFDMLDEQDRQVKTYSGGQRRRVDIAASLVVTPQLLFLDEPTTGLDPLSRRRVWDIVRVLVAEGTTIILTTQHLDEADELADRVAVIDHGTVVAQGTPAELKARTGTNALQVRLADSGQRAAATEVLARVVEAPVLADGDPAFLTAQVSDSERATQALSELSAAGIRVVDFSLGRPSLDEAFLALTGRRVSTSDSSAGEDPADSAVAAGTARSGSDGASA
jgi:ABC-2 type transport system ATP-binding protein